MTSWRRLGTNLFLKGSQFRIGCIMYESNASPLVPICHENWWWVSRTVETNTKNMQLSIIKENGEALFKFWVFLLFSIQKWWKITARHNHHHQLIKLAPQNRGKPIISLQMLQDMHHPHQYTLNQSVWAKESLNFIHHLKTEDWVCKEERAQLSAVVLLSVWLLVCLLVWLEAVIMALAMIVTGKFLHGCICGFMYAVLMYWSCLYIYLAASILTVQVNSVTIPTFHYACIYSSR